VVTDGGNPVLYQTDPAGTQSKWKAQVIGGRNAKSLREFLEKQYTAELDEAAALKLAVAALLEVVDSGAKTMQICIVRAGGVKQMLLESDIQAVVQAIEAEQDPTTGTGTTTTTAATTTE
jgi:20S proteasome subunit alpha 4